VAAAADGDWGTARQLQSSLAELLLSLRLPGRAPWTPRTASLKFLLRELGVIASDTCARPFTPLAPAEQEALRTTALPLVEQLESSAGAA
jgi:dihydrodipicolinate synthase/N-acetylneuraminate lyase